MVVVFVSSSFQQDLHILLCFPSKAILSLPSATSGPWRCRDYPMTPKSSDKISSRVYNNRACFISHYRQRLDYGKGKMFSGQSTVCCGKIKERGKDRRVCGHIWSEHILLMLMISGGSSN